MAKGASPIHPREIPTSEDILRILAMMSMFCWRPVITMTCPEIVMKAPTWGVIKLITAEACKMAATDITLTNTAAEVVGPQGTAGTVAVEVAVDEAAGEGGAAVHMAAVEMANPRGINLWMTMPLVATMGRVKGALLLAVIPS